MSLRYLFWICVLHTTAIVSVDAHITYFWSSVHWRNYTIHSTQSSTTTTFLQNFQPTLISQQLEHISRCRIEITSRTLRLAAAYRCMFAGKQSKLAIIQIRVCQRVKFTWWSRALRFCNPKTFCIEKVRARHIDLLLHDHFNRYPSYVTGCGKLQ